MTPDMPTNTPIETSPISPEVREKIFSRIVELSEPKEEPRFCVDGRTGPRKKSQETLSSKPYGQALGGDLNITSVEWLLNNGQENYLDTITNTFSNLYSAGYKQLGVHYGGHAHENSSDCGFADNMVAIIKTLISKPDEIWEIISSAVLEYPEIQLDKGRYLELITNHVQQADLNKLPTGKNIIDKGASLPNVTVQELQKDHKEVAAVVNLKPNTTLDADNNQDDAQAFNLDLWLVQQQAQDLDMNVENVTLLTLGLYVATEMILVENKRGVRLPVLINK